MAKPGHINDLEAPGNDSPKEGVGRSSRSGGIFIYTINGKGRQPIFLYMERLGFWYLLRGLLAVLLLEHTPSFPAPFG
jgi:hypothetical protein